MPDEQGLTVTIHGSILRNVLSNKNSIAIRNNNVLWLIYEDWEDLLSTYQMLRDFTPSLDLLLLPLTGIGVSEFVFDMLIARESCTLHMGLRA